VFVPLRGGRWPRRLRTITIPPDGRKQGWQVSRRREGRIGSDRLRPNARPASRISSSAIRADRRTQRSTEGGARRDLESGSTRRGGSIQKNGSRGVKAFPRSARRANLRRRHGGRGPMDSEDHKKLLSAGRWRLRLQSSATWSARGFSLLPATMARTAGTAAWGAGCHRDGRHLALLELTFAWLSRTQAVGRRHLCVHTHGVRRLSAGFLVAWSYWISNWGPTAELGDWQRLSICRRRWQSLRAFPNRASRRKTPRDAGLWLLQPASAIIALRAPKVRASSRAS